MNDEPMQRGVASTKNAISFVRELDLSGLPRSRAPVRSLLKAPFHSMLPLQARIAPGAMAVPVNGEGLDVKSGVAQAWLVGSQLVSFNEDVTEGRRKAALHSALLAQLAATKKVPFHEDPATARAWHATYVSTLTSIGWVLQGAEVTQNRSGETNVAVDRVILDIVGAVIPGGTALALAQRVIDALTGCGKRHAQNHLQRT